MNPRLKKILVVMFMLSGMLITAFLGRWQLNRADEKEQYMAAIQEKQSYPTMQNSQLLRTTTPEQLVHQPVQLTGVWQADRTVLLDNRQMHGKVGFFVMTPLKLAQSDTVVWVQRGWIPRHFLEREKIPDFQTPVGVVTVQGMIAPPPSKLYDFAKAEKGQIRQNLDIATETWSSGTTAFPLLVRQVSAASEGLQRDWPQVNAGVDKHYGYAAQWFGISGLMGILLLWFQWLAPWIKQLKKVSDHV